MRGRIGRFLEQVDSEIADDEVKEKLIELAVKVDHEREAILDEIQKILNGRSTAQRC